MQRADGKNGIRLRDENNIAYGVKHVNNKPRVSSMPYLYDIAEGNVSGHTPWSKIGYTPTMTTVESDLWSKAGVVNFPAAAMQMSVVSTDNTNDKASGTGALEVTIGYLDANYAEQSTVVILNGTTQVDTTPTNILRVNSFRVTKAGTAGKAAGSITLSDKATRAIVYSFITAGFTRARNSAYTVPAGKTLYVVSWTAGYGYSTNQTHYARLYTRATQNNEIWTPGIFYPYTEIVCANTSQYVEFLIPTKLVSKVDIKVSGISTFAGIASSSLRGWIE
jgi:hypothetical protein